MLGVSKVGLGFGFFILERPLVMLGAPSYVRSPLVMLGVPYLC